MLPSHIKGQGGHYTFATYTLFQMMMNVPMVKMTVTTMPSVPTP